METAKFIPDLEKVKMRAKIVPFGLAVNFEPKEPKVTNFVLYTTEQEVAPAEEQAEPYTVYTPVKPTGNYQIQGDIPVKITNIPLSISQNDIFTVLINACNKSNIECLKRRPFTRLNLVFDKEKKISRGFAYANCENLEKAKELAKVVRSIVLESCVLCAEVLNN